MKRRSFVATLLSLPVLSRFSFAQAASPILQGPAFQAGETLKYTLGWQFLVAGRATLEVLPEEEIDGKTFQNFKMTARTRSAIDKIYKVRDTLISRTDSSVNRAMYYEKQQHEGDSRRNETVTFDWDNLEAQYHEEISGKKKTTTIMHNTLDPLSAFYFVRNQPMEVGSVIKGPLSDGKRCKIAQVEVVKRETIKVNGTKYDTFKLIPDIKDVGGVFKKSKDATMEIWCTADHRHIPVLLKSKVLIGSFNAELVSISNA